MSVGVPWLPALLVAVALLFASGCERGDGDGADRPPPDGAGSISRAEALEIAREAIEARDAWEVPFEMTADPTETGWSVEAWRTPKVPGGHRVVEISRAGVVEAYHRGR